MLDCQRPFFIAKSFRYDRDKRWNYQKVQSLNERGDQVRKLKQNHQGLTEYVDSWRWNTTNSTAQTYKILGKVLYERLQIYTMNIETLEETTDFIIETHHLFLDIKAAYDSMQRLALHRAMFHLGTPKSLSESRRRRWQIQRLLWECKEKNLIVTCEIYF